jgi:hypothetical protein
VSRREANRRYEKTKKGFLMRAYRNMICRVDGTHHERSVSCYGQELLPKEEFYEWSLNNPDFHDLFEEWERAGYERRLSPSVNRIDPRFGYYLLNMQWVTLGEGSRRHVQYRYRGKIV